MITDLRSQGILAIPTALFSALLVSTSTLPSKAAALYFYKTAVKTTSEKTCYRFANDAARSLGFSNIRSNNLEVAGVKDGAYVSITCVGRGGGLQAVAVVMSVADTFEVAKSAGNLAGEKIKGISCFDSPC